jgi:hypothetical protein
VPVAGARIVVERPGFQGTHVVARADADDEGTFALEPFDGAPGDLLCVSGPLHAELRSAVPPAGELRVALVLRKRALLDRLVQWARAQGRPYDAAPEPTPGQVRRAAGTELTIARWADAIERAAFSSSVVDEKAEGDIARLAPEPGVPGKPGQTPEPRPRDREGKRDEARAPNDTADASAHAFPPRDADGRAKDSR